MTDPTAPPVTPERIMQLAWGYAPPLILEAAIRNRVFDVLDEKPRTVSEVHRITGASIRGLAPIMNFLVGMNFLTKDAEGRFALTEESSTFLVSTRPSFHGGVIRHLSSQLIPSWLQINRVVETGKPAASVNKEGTGSDFFIELVNDIFPLSYGVAQELAAHLNLGGSDSEVKALDLATGSGVWGIALAQSSPQVKVTAVDWPAVLPVTRASAERMGVADQFSFIPGDLKDADFGSGYQVATLGHILHSEGEMRSKTLLKKTFDALAPGGTIAIAEFLVNEERTGPLVSLIFAVNMLITTDAGDTWSFAEISTWLTEAGFTNARILETHGPSPLILATRP
jgi:ubiquinone/menaquinone biosynthesis C-methylase UbiE